MIELGRYLVGECGVYVTRVVDRKVSRGKTFLVVDGGMHHQLARVRQLRAGHPAQLPARSSATGCRRGADRDRVTSSAASAPRWTCWGTRSSCHAADVGDLVVIFQAGAYGLTASPTAFLGHPAPREVLV